MELDELLERFEEAWSLAAYHAARKRHEVPMNDEIVAEFIRFGERGISYLSRALNRNDISMRQKAVHVLGEMGDRWHRENKAVERRMLSLLDSRERREDEKGVKHRILYAEALCYGANEDTLQDIVDYPYGRPLNIHQGHRI